MYDGFEDREADYAPGNVATLLAVVDRVAIVDEDKLSWQQVHEFRGDPEARRAYRAFVHWLDRDLVGRSEQYIEDAVGRRLTEYEWALRKHGVATAIGAMERALSPSVLFSAAAGGTLASLVSGDTSISVLAATGVMVGQATLRVASAMLSRQDIKAAHAEVALVHTLKR